MEEVILAIKFISFFLREFKPIKNLPSMHAATKRTTIPTCGVTNNPSPLEDVFKPTIGPNKAREIRPVNKLSLIIDLRSKEVFIILSQCLVYLKNLLEKILV